MPNHVHVIIDRLRVALDSVLHSWRSYTSNEIRKRLSEHEMPERDRLWQRGYFDRYIRDGRHLWATRCYILLNPVHAGLVGRATEWPFSSAKTYEREDLDVVLNGWFGEHMEGFLDVPY
jgi:REP element-mobilizing transposase RayT